MIPLVLGLKPAKQQHIRMFYEAIARGAGRQDFIGSNSLVGHAHTKILLQAAAVAEFKHLLAGAGLHQSEERVGRPGIVVGNLRGFAGVFVKHVAAKPGTKLHIWLVQQRPGSRAHGAQILLKGGVVEPEPGLGPARERGIERRARSGVAQHLGFVEDPRGFGPVQHLGRVVEHLRLGPWCPAKADQNEPAQQSPEGGPPLKKTAFRSLQISSKYAEDKEAPGWAR